MMLQTGGLAVSDGFVIAYARRRAQEGHGGRAGVVFLPGFRSDMTGAKALHADAWAEARGRACLRLDYRGHGASSGVFEEGCVGDWAADALAAFDALTEGPQILVGSSMGGWIGLLIARERPERVAGFIGLAAAPDFTEDLIKPALTPENWATLEREGRLVGGAPDWPEIYTRRLLEDGARRLVLRSPLEIRGPVRLIHGTEDKDVPQATALRLLAHVASPDARLTLVKGAGHRLSEPRELAILTAALDDIAG